ncbi:MAG: cysteine desulfurase [Defluviitaleaceae bacterium]|nr:cysteine desulfurase [Defluviitaleaceae bacterium]
MIYLDNAATTKPSQEVIEVFLESMSNDFMNPSSLHDAGLSTLNKIEDARKTIASLLNVNAAEIFFTSGGTEANNIAINLARGDIITTVAEHDSVLSPIERKKARQKVSYLKLDKYAKVDVQSLQNFLSEKTSFISIMHTNNELGTINEIDKLGKIIKETAPSAIFHVDCIAAFSKEDISLRYVDIATFSSHKIHGPKGVGAIWAKNGKALPLTFGGSQESKVRPGTENTNGIITFAKAAEIAFAGKEKNREYVEGLKKTFLENLQIKYNVNSPEDASPYVLNISFLGMKAQVLVNALSAEKIFVSTGAACTSYEKRNTLKNLGLANEIYETAIRISFSCENTIKEMQIVAKKINELSKLLILR